MHRYLAVIWNPHSLTSVRAAQSFCAALKSQPTEWPIAYEGPGALVAHTASRRGSSEAYPLEGNSGVILGKLFNHHHRHDDRTSSHAECFDGKETQRIVNSGGRHVIEHYWGSYVAFVHAESACKHHVFRDPIGTMPCYHTAAQGVDVFFSDVEDCIRFFPIAFSINRRFLTRWIIFSGTASRETGLENVEEPPGGECMTFFRGSITRSLLWNPVEIARTPRFDQPDEAARELRSTVESTIGAWASCYQDITLKLSGGLDSSIVAACLARAPSQPRLTCINFSSRIEHEAVNLRLSGLDKRTFDKVRALVGSDDERHFARLVAERWKVPLTEECEPSSMDPNRLWRVPLQPVPARYFGRMYVDDAQIGLARSIGTQAFFSGEEGDNIFLATLQPLSAIDYAFLHGIKHDFWKHLFAACNLSKETLWAVLLQAIRHGILRLPLGSRDFLQAPTLLRQELTQNLTNRDFESPIAQLSSCSSLPPGKRVHVAGLGANPCHHSRFHSAKYADHIHPLASQPIWELMLQIPIHTILTDGITRGLARRAFADVLPAEIHKRRAKGSGASSLQQLLRDNKTFWREQLENGLLVQEGYLDRQKLADCLDAEEPFLVASSSHIAFCLTAEIWLQQWRAVREQQREKRAELAATVVA